MTEDIEERFRQACSAYLAAAEEHDRACMRDAAAFMAAQDARLAADRARDELLAVVRQRDIAAGLAIREERVRPSDGAAAARNRWLTGPGVSAMRPEDTDWWAQHGGMCPECGVSWRKPSEDCPHKVVNWHPLSNDYTLG